MAGASRRGVVALLAAVAAAALGVLSLARTADDRTAPDDATADGGDEGAVPALPPPTRDGALSVEAAIARRRSRREYADTPLELAALAQLLWAAQGVTEPRDGLRAAPSAGARYPLELRVAVTGDAVTGLPSGVYRYDPAAHALARTIAGDVRPALAAAALSAPAVADAPVTVVVSAVDERTTERYGERGERRYVPMEAGHAGENLALQAEALGFSTVSIGAFDDDAVRDAVRLDDAERPLYVFPVGNRV